MIRTLRGAARSVFAQRIAIGMDHEGGFTVAGPEWGIVLAQNGEITGRGELSQESYEEFLHAVCDRLQISHAALQPQEENDIAFSPSL